MYIHIQEKEKNFPAKEEKKHELHYISFRFEQK
jgi:hypothetical protein